MKCLSNISFVTGIGSRQPYSFRCLSKNLHASSLFRRVCRRIINLFLFVSKIDMINVILSRHIETEPHASALTTSRRIYIHINTGTLKVSFYKSKHTYISVAINHPFIMFNIITYFISLVNQLNTQKWFRLVFTPSAYHSKYKNKKYFQKPLDKKYFLW